MNQSDHRRTGLIASAVLLLVFVTGALASAAVIARPASSVEAEPRVRIATGSAFEELGLDESQRAAVDEVFARRQPEVDAIIGSAMRDVRVVMDDMHEEIRAVMTPEQAEAFDELRGSGAQIRAVRRTMTSSGDTISIDTVTVDSIG